MCDTTVSWGEPGCVTLAPNCTMSAGRRSSNKALVSMAFCVAGIAIGCYVNTLSGKVSHCPCNAWCTVLVPTQNIPVRDGRYGCSCQQCRCVAHELSMGPVPQRLLVRTALYVSVFDSMAHGAIVVLPQGRPVVFSSQPQELPPADGNQLSAQ